MAKSPNAFRTISEAAEEVGVPQHVLRFWETKFPFVAPVKRAGGRRFYRPQDLSALKGVRRLLHDEGLTIRGVQRLHKEHGLKRITGQAADEPADGVAARPDPSPESPAVARPDPVALRAVLARLETARARLDAVLDA